MWLPKVIRKRGVVKRDGCWLEGSMYLYVNNTIYLHPVLSGFDLFWTLFHEWLHWLAEFLNSPLEVDDWVDYCIFLKLKKFVQTATLH